MHHTVLFNFNDLALWLVIFNGIIFAAILLSVKRGKQLCHSLLAGFILVLALQAFDTLMQWSTPFKTAFFSGQSLSFIAIKFAPLLQGPLLYLYTRALVYSDFRLQKNSLWHALIPALYVPWCVFIALSLQTQGLLASAHDYDILFEQAGFKALLVVEHLSLAAYTVACFGVLMHYQRELAHSQSASDGLQVRWLQMLIGGFAALWFAKLATQFGHQLGFYQFANHLGLLSNYLLFVFVTVLVVFSLLNAHIVIGIPSNADFSGKDAAKGSSGTNQDTEEVPPEHIAKLEHAIHEQCIYLDEALTLEQLANALDLHPRAVSKVINQHYKQNFFEFINYFRVEKAKALVIHQPDMPMLDVMAEAGFSSKSAFNRFFKKYTELTPTEYRKRNIPSQ